jgi:hypothetical protein
VEQRVLLKQVGIGPTCFDAHGIAPCQPRTSLHKAVVKQAQADLDRRRQQVVERWTANARENGIVQGQSGI